MQCRRGVGGDSGCGIALQIAERSQEQISLPEHESVPWRVWEAIEEAVLLARGGVELRAASDGDQLSGEVAACILERIFRAVEQDGRWTAFGDLPTGHDSAGRAL